VQRWAEQRGWDDVVEILSDGEVTADEQEYGVSSYVRCLEALGFEFGEREPDPISGFRLSWTEVEYAGPGEWANEAEYDACEQRYFVGVQLVYEATHEQVMDPTLADGVRACLGEVGRETDGKETKLEDFYAPGESWAPGDEVVSCVEEQMRVLFPEIVGHGISF